MGLEQTMIEATQDFFSSMVAGGLQSRGLLVSM